VNLVQGVLDAILPARCPVCNAYLQGEIGLCADCVARLEPAVDGQMIHLGRYRGHLDRVAHALKFANRRAVAVPVGAKLAQGIRTAGWTVDAVVPVPLYWVRDLERGYNQSRVLAQAIAPHLETPVLDALERSRSTLRQAKLPKAERAQNVQDAFNVTQDVTGLEILLVDDVHTSGATLTEASLALISKGAKRVRIAVISKVSDGRKT
jgi:ComF family protein